jgi:SHS2 domain-containing protein
MMHEVNARSPYWEHFAHGADIGVRGVGSTLAEAFEQAALAMTAVVTEPSRIASLSTVEVECTAPDPELLFVDWLNRIVYEMAVGRYLFGAFEVSIDGMQLRGRLHGEPVDVGRHQPAVEVKGATMTALSVARGDEAGWIAQCVVDV